MRILTFSLLATGLALSGCGSKENGAGASSSGGSTQREAGSWKSSVTLEKFEMPGAPPARPAMPGAVPRTSTFALTNATLPYALDLANKGFEQAIKDDAGLREGVNTYAGKLTYEAVATSQNLEYTPLESLIDLKAAAA